MDNTPSQPSTFRTKNWVEINDDSQGMYNSNSQIKFKTLMLNSSLCDYNDEYIFVKGTITITGGSKNATDPDKQSDKRNEGVIFKICSPYVSEISNTRMDNTKDIDTIMPICNLMECSDSFSKTVGCL